MATTTGMRRPLRRALAAAAVAASLLLAGCGGEEPPPPPDVDSELKLEPATTTDAAGAPAGEGTPIVLAAAATTDAGSARIAIQSTTELAGVTTEVATEGVFDFANQSGSMEGSIGGVPTVTVMDGGVGYTQLAPEMASALQGKRWLKVEAGGSQPGAPGGTAPGPDTFLRVLESSSSGLTEVGEEQVRGGDTATHYTATMDVASHPNGQELAPLLGDSLPVEVWVDAEGLLRKIVTETTLSAPDVGEVTSSSTVELWDFGAPVEVTVPPADQVATTDELTEALKGAFSGG